MQDDYRKIIIKRIIHERQGYSQSGDPLNTSPVNRWAFYLALIPVVIVVVVLGAFFFSIVLALFVAVATVVGARLWWLRRKLNQSMRSNDGKNGMIEDAEIVEIREEGKKPHE